MVAAIDKRRVDIVTATAALFLVTGAVNLQMPLYGAYAAAAGHGTSVIALAFAAYIAGLLPTLLLLGGISDRVGRRKALTWGLSAALAATTLMLAWPEMRTLFVSRTLQGVGVGLSMGAGAAYLSERQEHADSNRATARVTAATSLGFGSGALFTATVLLGGTTLRPVSLWVHGAAAIVCLLLVRRLDEQPPRGGRLLRLPSVSPETLPAGLAISTAWAVTGVVISLLPSQLAVHGLSVWGGHALFLVNGTGVLVQSAARRLPPRRSLQVGFALLPVGFLAVLLGAWQGLLSLVLIGTVTCGAACYGFTYLGGLAVVNRADPARRARAVSGYFLCGYLGFGLPSVLIGFLSEGIGLMAALSVFGAVLTLACLILAGRFRLAVAVASVLLCNVWSPARAEQPAASLRAEESRAAGPSPSLVSPDRTLNLAVWLRVGTFMSNTDASRPGDDLYGSGLLQLMLNGRVHPNVGWQADLRADYGGGTMNSDASLLDVIAKLESSSNVLNLWLGRMLVPSDRSNFSGPWFISPFFYPGMYGGPDGAAVGPRRGPGGRNNGATLWGQLGGGLFKYYAGVFDLHAPEEAPLLSTRLGLSLLSPEPGFGSRSAYFGEDRLAVGANFQLKRRGSQSPPPLMGQLPLSDDYRAAGGDLLFEKAFGSGVGTIESAYQQFFGRFERHRWHAFVLLACGARLPANHEWVQVLVRLQRAGVRLPTAGSAHVLDLQATYAVDKHAIKVMLGYSAFRLLASKSHVALLGVQIMR